MSTNDTETTDTAELRELARRLAECSSAITDTVNALESEGIESLELSTRTARLRINNLEGFVGKLLSRRIKAINTVAEDRVRYARKRANRK